jgi:hypothetical protein
MQQLSKSYLECDVVPWTELNPGDIVTFCWYPATTTTRYIVKSVSSDGVVVVVTRDVKSAGDARCEPEWLVRQKVRVVGKCSS